MNRQRGETKGKSTHRGQTNGPKDGDRQMGSVDGPKDEGRQINKQMETGR